MTAAKKRGRPRSERCQRGHAMEGSNVGVSATGGRACLVCRRMKIREWKRKQRVLARELRGAA